MNYKILSVDDLKIISLKLKNGEYTDDYLKKIYDFSDLDLKTIKDFSINSENNYQFEFMDGR